MDVAESCPLCGGSIIEEFASDRTRAYLRCGACALIFVPRKDLLPPDVEKSRYDFHQNSPDDSGYRNFLNKIFMPVNEMVGKGSCGLDFGSGPGPTLSRMFEEVGHRMQIYDPFYADNPSVFQTEFDFITASEVAEHLFNPGVEFDRLWDLLVPGGVLGVMTKFVPSDVDFSNWYYKNDDTHVVFYSAGTFEYMAQRWNCRLDLHNGEVACFTKTAPFNMEKS